MTSIVILFGSGFDSGQVSALTGERSKLEAIIEASATPVTVNVVSLGLSRTIPGVVAHTNLPADDLGPADRFLSLIGAYALRRKLAEYPIGRLLNSLGPVDQGRVFWRAVRRSRSALALIRSADIAIAADMPATKTAWMALRRKYVSQSFYDHRSASVGATFQLPQS